MAGMAASDALGCALSEQADLSVWPDGGGVSGLGRNALCSGSARTARPRAVGGAGAFAAASGAATRAVGDAGRGGGAGAGADAAMPAARATTLGMGAGGGISLGDGGADQRTAGAAVSNDCRDLCTGQRQAFAAGPYLDAGPAGLPACACVVCRAMGVLWRNLHAGGPDKTRLCPAVDQRRGQSRIAAVLPARDHKAGVAVAAVPARGTLAGLAGTRAGLGAAGADLVGRLCGAADADADETAVVCLSGLPCAVAGLGRGFGRCTGGAFDRTRCGSDAWRGLGVGRAGAGGYRRRALAGNGAADTGRKPALRRSGLWRGFCTFASRTFAGI